MVADSGVDRLRYTTDIAHGTSRWFVTSFRDLINYHSYVGVGDLDDRTAGGVLARSSSCY